ncbi:MAG: hypothetical protein J7500_18345 [Sphingomonas sp.]|uniref:hypothetical protein n=1 Tax=Sphingomonas sp. TaxID=28214 RepID=UPI001B224A6C|nr:hypothetical protein [Sphingomonas sp.]MBO9624673.1 hypothetical protein [Sphingomonas sp.]
MRRLVVSALAGMLLLAVPAQAQEKGATRPGFSAGMLRGQKVLLFRPDVWVGSQSTGGMAEPNGDWTEQARGLLEAELRARLAGSANPILPEPELSGDDALDLAEHKALFNTVAHAVVTYQFFRGNRLPTRKNKPFDWTLGPGARRLSERTGARYGLFLLIHDEYGSFGRKAFQILAAGLGASVKSGVHRGYAGLVDLETGELLWLNADEAMGGDVRDAEGMKKRVAQLLEDLPVRAAPAK